MEKIKVKTADDYVLNYIITGTKVNISAEIRHEIHPKFLKMTIENVQMYENEKSIAVEPDSEDEELRNLYMLVKRGYVDSIIDYLSKAK